MSSLSSYGRGDEKTFRPIRLDDPQRPDTAYGQSKLEAENYIRKQTYFPYVILRPTGVYGPGEKDYFMEIQSVKPLRIVQAYRAESLLVASPIAA